MMIHYLLKKKKKTMNYKWDRIKESINLLVITGHAGSSTVHLMLT